MTIYSGEMNNAGKGSHKLSVFGTKREKLTLYGLHFWLAVLCYPENQIEFVTLVFFFEMVL